jgi:hypothetical protein
MTTKETKKDLISSLQQKKEKDEDNVINKLIINNFL